MGGLKTCSVTISPLVRLTDPGMVDPSVAFSADDSTKLMILVPLVDALLLSNPRPILQLGDIFVVAPRTPRKLFDLLLRCGFGYRH
ncbi:hypothetical protein Tco_0834512 [Tanacetum coccineum]